MTTSTNLLDYIPQGLLADRPTDPTTSPGTHPDAIPFYFATDGGLAAYINGAWVNIPSGGGIPLADGDKGDVIVSSSGTVWTIDNDVVTYAKMQNVSATDKLLGRSTSGAGDVEEIACTAAGRALLDDADASAQRTTLGLAIGTNVKAQAPSVQSVTGAATVTPTFSDDGVKITAQDQALTLANPSGTAVPMWGWAIRIKDNGTARAISYGTQYRAIGVTLPSTTVISKTLYLGCIWNDTDTKVDVVAVAQQA